jgi:hydrogenase maturation factor
MAELKYFGMPVTDINLLHEEIGMGGHSVAYLIEHYAVSQKVAGFSPVDVIELFQFT